MKVGIVVAGDGLTGAPRRLLALADQFRKQGVDASLITQPNHPIVGLAVERTVPVAYIKRPKNLGPGLRARKGIHKFTPLLSLSLFWLRQLQFIIFSAKFDVIILRSGLSGLMYLPFYYVFRGKVVLDLDYEVKDSTFAEIASKIAFKRCQVIISQYQRVFDEVVPERDKPWVKQKFHVVIPGIDIDCLEEIRKKTAKKEENSPLILIQVGSFHPRKNQLFSLSLLDKLIHEHQIKNVVLRFVGGESNAHYYQECISFVREKELNQYVEFLGWRNDAALLIAQSDLLLMPSLDEGVPNVVQEAMVLGAIVIASKAGGISEVIRKNGEFGYSLSLAEADTWLKNICLLIGQPNLKKDMVADARSYSIQNFTYKCWVQSYLRIMQDTLSLKISKW